MLINIKKPWYSAWKKFGWERDTWGVQITMTVLKKLASSGEELLVRFRDTKKTFSIDAKRALEFVQNNKSKTTITIVKEAGVIPVQLMKPVIKKKQPPKKNVKN